MGDTPEKDALHAELMKVMQEKFKTCTDGGRCTRDAIAETMAAVTDAVFDRIQAARTDSDLSMIREVVDNICQLLREKFAEAAKNKEQS